MCVFLCLWTGRGLATSWSPVQGVLPIVRDLVNWSETESFMEVGQGPSWGCSAKGKKNTGYKHACSVSIFNLHCLHPVVYHDRRHLAVNTTVNKNKPFELLTLVLFNGFCPDMRRSVGTLIKYISSYWAVLVWIHISATVTKLQELFYF
jgi:hypothetical protein